MDFVPTALLPVYGLAEASLAVTAGPMGREPVVDRIERKVFESEGKAIPTRAEDENCIAFVSAGKPVPRHEIRVVDNAGVEVAERTEGFLWFRGPSATTGYYQNKAATDALLPLGPGDGNGEFAWVNSGDRAYIADGELYVTGRVKDIIIKGGRNLYPHEVEELAARIEGIRKGCIVAFGIKDQASGTEKMVVVAESRETNDARRLEMAAKVTEVVSRGLGLPPDRVELLATGQHSEDVEREIAPGRDETTLSGGNAVGEQGAGVAANCAAGRRRSGFGHRPSDCEWREAWAGSSVTEFTSRWCSRYGSCRRG